VGLRLLYVGQPGTPRAEAFTRFLGERFDEVRAIALTDLDPAAFTDVDVAIVDGEHGQEPQPPHTLFTDQFPVPTVLVGAYGGKVADALGLKLGCQNGCICLDHRAILEPGTTDHALFAGPVEVPAMEPQKIAAPHAFRAHGTDVPATIDVFAVHEGEPLPDPTEEETLELARRVQEAARTGDTAFLQSLVTEQSWGLVSTAAGFLDSPDCERILGGVNSKGYDYIALGRQARFLQWGFEADPSRMTDAGRALFLNAIHYVAGFADAPVLSAAVTQPREMLHYVLGLLDRGDRQQERLALMFGGACPDDLKPNATDALAWYDENRGYLRRVGASHSGHYEIDADLRELGLANDDLRLLDHLCERLEDERADGDRARRVWTRYTHRDVLDGAAEKQWLGQHRDALFFSDWGGYRWLSSDEPVTLHAPRYDLAEHGPVSALMTAEYVGEDISVDIRLDVQPGYFLYAPGAPDGIPVSVTVDGGSGRTVLDGPTIPITDDLHLGGTVPITLRLVGGDPVVRVEVKVQACDEQVCLAPTTFALTAVAGR